MDVPVLQVVMLMRQAHALFSYPPRAVVVEAIGPT